MADDALPDLDKLIKLLGMTSSSADGEALTAMRMANREADKFGGWRRILASRITVIGANPFTSVPPPPPPRTSHAVPPSRRPTAPPPPPPPYNPFRGMVRFGYNDTFDLKDEFGRLGGRWNPNEKFWYFFNSDLPAAMRLYNDHKKRRDFKFNPQKPPQVSDIV